MQERGSKKENYIYTIIWADDTAQLDFLSQFNSCTRPNALREEHRAGQTTEESNFAEKLLSSACERDWRLLFDSRAKTAHPARYKRNSERILRSLKAICISSPIQQSTKCKFPSDSSLCRNGKTTLNKRKKNNRNWNLLSIKVDIFSFSNGAVLLFAADLDNLIFGQFETVEDRKS